MTFGSVTNPFQKSELYRSLTSSRRKQWPSPGGTSSSHPGFSIALGSCFQNPHHCCWGPGSCWGSKAGARGQSGFPHPASASILHPTQPRGRWGRAKHQKLEGICHELRVWLKQTWAPSSPRVFGSNSHGFCNLL